MTGQVRTLPTDEDESRVLNSFWMSTNIPPAHANPVVDGDGPPPHCNASLLVNHAIKLALRSRPAALTRHACHACHAVR